MSHECVLDAQPAFDAVYCEGIRAVDDFDVATADRLGFSIKLLGISSKVGDKVLQRVHPGAQRWVALRPHCFLSCTRLIWPGWPWWHLPLSRTIETQPPGCSAMIPTTTALGSTHGVLNGLFTVGNFVGPCFTQGRPL
jgi:hypothetical protein|eukprot:SAG25_NODE_463_length_7790_cov_6.841654_9_plen_138_part_00